MAYSTTRIDTNRGTTGLQLTPEQSNEIWANAIENSAVMQLAEKVRMPGSGVTIPIITGDATAEWVGETEEKHVSNPTFGIKQMTPYKIAVIELFSNEFRRDFKALYAELIRRLPKSIGKRFDETVFGGTAPGTNFDVLTNCTAAAIGGTGTYGKLVNVYTTLAAAGADLTGWAISPQAKGILLNAVDGTGRPLLINDINNQNSISRILGAKAYETKAVYKQGASSNPNVVGFAGDWSQARWGQVEAIQLKISDQATVNDGTNQINLWQRNMFGVLVECELAFGVKSTNSFLRLTDATS